MHNVGRILWQFVYEVLDLSGEISCMWNETTRVAEKNVTQSYTRLVFMPQNSSFWGHEMHSYLLPSPNQNLWAPKGISFLINTANGLFLFMAKLFPWAVSFLNTVGLIILGGPGKWLPRQYNKSAPSLHVSCSNNNKILLLWTRNLMCHRFKSTWRQKGSSCSTKDPTQVQLDFAFSK